jgi:hypothetical protein
LPILIGVIVATSAVVLARRDYLKLSDAGSVFTISLALTPLVLLNQQVVTGLSLQPVHFEIFVANYLSLLSAVSLFACLVRSNKPLISPAATKKILIYAGALSLLWGTVETVTAVNRSKFAAEVRDRSVGAIKLAENDARGVSGAVVLTPDMVTADFVQSVSNLRPMWSPHTSSGGGVSLAENKRLFFLYLYLNGITDKELADALRAGVFEVTAAVFASDRALPELGSGTHSISAQDISREAGKFQSFTSNIDKEGVYNPQINFVVVPAASEPDYSRLDRCYRRELIGEADGFRIYRLARIQM